MRSWTPITPSYERMSFSISCTVSGEAGAPSSSFIVSLNMPIPVAMMNRATTIPMYPSSGTEVNFERIRAIIDTVVAAVSLTLSITTAPTAVEFILCRYFC